MEIIEALSSSVQDFRNCSDCFYNPMFKFLQFIIYLEWLGWEEPILLTLIWKNDKKTVLWCNDYVGEAFLILFQKCHAHLEDSYCLGLILPGRETMISNSICSEPQKLNTMLLCKPLTIHMKISKAITNLKLN